MKKLSILCAVLLLFGAGYVMAQPNYQVDVAGDGNKNFETEVLLSSCTTLTLDIYLADANGFQNAGGAWLDFSGSTADIAYLDAGRALTDGSEGVVGPWDPNTGILLNEPAGPGTIMYVVANLAGASPDSDGDLIIGSITLESVGWNDASITITTIPSVATWTPINDADVVAGSITVWSICGCSMDADCDDGLFCTGVEECDEECCICYAGTPPCDDGNECTIDCDETTDSCLTDVCDPSAILGPTSPCCAEEPCASVCPGGDAILINEDGYYQPPSEPGAVETIKNKVCLENPSDLIGGIQFDICDTPDCLTCIDCELTERTVMFDCLVLELPNGCCRVIMFCINPGCAINPGECNIVTVVVQTNNNPDCGEDCIIKEITNIVISDYHGFALAGAGVSGFLCPVVCGDVCPPGTGTANDCGDGMVDIYDIMCEVDLALTATAPNDCQTARGDVPIGTPPWCTEPDGNINILDIMVLIDMALNRQDCCSFYYTGVIY